MQVQHPGVVSTPSLSVADRARSLSLHPWYAAQQRRGCPYAVDDGKEIIDVASEAHSESVMNVSCDCDQIGS
jgi:hypothetical protein